MEFECNLKRFSSIFDIALKLQKKNISLISSALVPGGNVVTVRRSAMLDFNLSIDIKSRSVRGKPVFSYA